MRPPLALLTVLLLAVPLAAQAQDGRAALEAAARALGADSLKTLEFSGHGVQFALGRSAAAGQSWPRFTLKSFTRGVNYETASLRDELVRNGH